MAIQTIGNYDALGNPWKYKDIALEWKHGRNLVKYGSNITYTYNSDGLRTSKTIGNTETTYYLDGSRIIAEERRANGTLTDMIHYHYGIDGIAGFKHNDVNYLYRKNVHGDITHIYEKDINGNLTQKVRYVYDAWGNTSITDDSDQAIAKMNGFRYRGYYYDGQTGDSGLYYLQSRYYDPEVGRFVNADDVSELDSETLNGLNLYAYTLNDPIGNIDPTDNAPKWWEWLVSGALLCVSLMVLGSLMMASNCR